MNNHFGKGLMAGLHAPYAYSAHHAVNFCSEYKRGFVLGFTPYVRKRPAIVNLARGRLEF